MRKLIAALFLFGLPALVLVADDKPKSKAEKKPIEAFTDAARAGPDYSIQGEYVAEHNGNKVGVHVIAEGDGAYHVKGYKGGLPGDGWDGQGTKEGKAKTENGKVTFIVENV